MKRIESKLPKLQGFDAPKRSAVVPADEAPVISDSAYRGRPRRELAEREPEAPKPVVADAKAATMPRNVALFLIALAAGLGFLLGRSL